MRRRSSRTQPALSHPAHVSYAGRVTPAGYYAWSERPESARGAENWVWVGEFSYVWTADGWLYFAVVLDRYSRAVIGWAWGPAHCRVCPTGAADGPPALQPEDRTVVPLGSGQSVCGDALSAGPRHPRYRSQHVAHGEWRDNPCVERFFGTLKRELIYHCRYRIREEAKQDISEYIEVCNNRLRRHSTLGYYSPAEFEARMVVA